MFDVWHESLTLTPPTSATGKRWRVVIIESGISANRNCYSASVLREAIPLFENSPVRIYAFDGRKGKVEHNDHAPVWISNDGRGGAVAGNTVGLLRDIKLESVYSVRQNRTVEALTGDLIITDPTTRTRFLEAHNAGAMDPTRRQLYELSIEAEGPHHVTFREGREVRMVEKISRVRETTIVSEGSAGGRTLALVESDANEILLESHVKSVLINALNTMGGGNGSALEYLSLQQLYDLLVDVGNNMEQAENPAAAPMDSDPNAQADPNTPADPTQLPQLQKTIQFLRAGDLQSGIGILEDVIRGNANPNSGASMTSPPRSVDEAPGSAPSFTGNANTSQLRQPAVTPHSTFQGAPTPEDPDAEMQPGDEEEEYEGASDAAGAEIPEEEEADPNASPPPVSPRAGTIPSQNVGNFSPQASATAPMAGDPNAPAPSPAGRRPIPPQFKKRSKSSVTQESYSSSHRARTQTRMEPNHMNRRHPTEPANGSIPGNQEPLYTQSEVEAILHEATQPQQYATLRESVEPEMSSLTEADLVDFVQHTARKQAKMQQKLDRTLRESKQLQQGVVQNQTYNLISESQAVLANCLRNSGLLKQAQTLVAQQFQDRVFTEAEVLHAIEAQRRLCETYAEAFGEVVREERKNLPVHVQRGRSHIDFVEAEIHRAFGYDWRKDSNLSESEKDIYRNLDPMPSIKRPFMDLYDDRSGLLQGKVGPNALIREATSLDLPQLLGDSMNRALIQQYMDQPPLWREFANVVPVSNFKEQKRILMGGLGYLPTVVQGDDPTVATYFSLGFPRDEQQTYSIGTFGGLIIVTRQAIIDDDLQGIQRYPREAASSAVMTLNRNVLYALQGVVSGVPNAATSYTGLEYYHVGHGNIITAGGISYNNFVDSLQKLAEVRRFANVTRLDNAITAGDTTLTVPSAAICATFKAGDDIVIYGGAGPAYAEFAQVVSTSNVTITFTPAIAENHADNARVESLGPPIAFEDVKILHTTRQKANVFQLLASALIPGSALNDASALFPDYNTGKVKPYAVHPMYMLNQYGDYFVAAGRPVECGFLGGKEEPEVWLQDNPLVDNVFRGDQITWKVRHEHGQVLTDHKLVSAGIF